MAPFGTNLTGCSFTPSVLARGLDESVGSMRLIIDVQNYSAGNETKMTFGIGEYD